jgi:hypothetical protein
LRESLLLLGIAIVESCSGPPLKHSSLKCRELRLRRDLDSYLKSNI